MTHTEALDCPCGPITVKALAGGSVQIHRDDAGQGERKPQTITCPGCQTQINLGVQDPYCSACGTWHLRGKHVALLSDLEDEVHALPAEGLRHVGLFIEKAAVLALLDPRRRKKVA